MVSPMSLEECISISGWFTTIWTTIVHWYGKNLPALALIVRTLPLLINVMSHNNKKDISRNNKCSIWPSFKDTSLPNKCRVWPVLINVPINQGHFSFHCHQPHLHPHHLHLLQLWQLLHKREWFKTGLSPKRDCKKSYVSIRQLCATYVEANFETSEPCQLRLTQIRWGIGLGVGNNLNDSYRVRQYKHFIFFFFCFTW